MSIRNNNDSIVVKFRYIFERKNLMHMNDNEPQYTVYTYSSDIWTTYSL